MNTEFDYAAAEESACTEDYCHICRAATDHFGEHSREQILAWSNRTPYRMRQV